MTPQCKQGSGSQNLCAKNRAVRNARAQNAMGLLIRLSQVRPLQGPPLPKPIPRYRLCSVGASLEQRLGATSTAWASRTTGSRPHAPIAKLRMRQTSRTLPGSYPLELSILSMLGANGLRLPGVSNGMPVTEQRPSASEMSFRNCCGVIVKAFPAASARRSALKYMVRAHAGDMLHSGPAILRRLPTRFTAGSFASCVPRGRIIVKSPFSHCSQSFSAISLSVPSRTSLALRPRPSQT
jgi:hypothetical protein